MPITIIATPGAADANSFLTETDADAYLAQRLNASAWTGDNRLIALVEATRELSALSWVGERVDATQALAWPRQYVINPDDPNGSYYATTVIPQRVKDATCELALQFLKAGTTDLAVADTNAGVIEKTVDVLTTKWASPSARPTGLQRFPNVLRSIRVLLVGVGASVPTVRT